jgi:signal peptidase I
MFSVALAVVAAAGVWRLRRGWAVITVEGSSMEPTFHDGDRVAVRRTPTFRVMAGEVVVIAKPGFDNSWRNSPAPIRDDRRWMIKRVGAVAGEPVPRMAGYFPADRLLGHVVRRMH